MHADGTNRWFDKSFSLIVHGDGLSAVNFEHSWGDGVAVLRMVLDVYRDSCDNHWVHPDTAPSDSVDISKSVCKLDFHLSNKLKHVITEAKQSYRKFCDRLAFSGFEYKNMNKDIIKGRKLSPDAVIQLAIQLGFYKQYGFTPCSYESCSTAAFRHGRTEAMRPATSDTKRCVQAFLSKEQPSAEELVRLIRAASKKHTHLVKEASMGQGFDRHLFGLRVTAERLNRKIPEIFTDETYSLAHHFTVSSSTLSSDRIILGGFGPVTEDGYGIGYNVDKNRMGMIVSAYPPNRDPKAFADFVSESLDDIFKVLECSK